MKRYSLTKDKYLSTEELLTLGSSIECHPGRNTALLALAINTGARASELLAITKADLDFETKSVYIRGLKGSRDRWIPLHDEIFAQVAQHIPFGISYSMLNLVWQKYKPVDKKFHSLRHTFAVNLYRRTKDIKLVQIALGHTSLLNTMVYVDYVVSQEELRRIIA